jgi:hypothetical protein
LARFAPNELEVAFAIRQKAVENGGIASLPRLAFLYQQTYVFAQISRAIQKSPVFKVGSAPCNHWETRLSEPVQYILVTLQDVDELSVPSHSRV